MLASGAAERATIPGIYPDSEPGHRHCERRKSRAAGGTRDGEARTAAVSHACGTSDVLAVNPQHSALKVGTQLAH
jgi:hypothetical protein